MQSTSCKVCFKCGAEKPLTDFYKHSKMADGHVNKCKSCNKKDVLKNREDKIDYYREYDKSRSNLDHRVEARKAYAKTESGSLNVQKAKRNYIEKNPKIRSAHIAVGNAVRDGNLIKPSRCEGRVCMQGDGYVEAHHCDYNKPLEVMWLCDRCHKDWHLKNTPIY